VGNQKQTLERADASDRKKTMTHNLDKMTTLDRRTFLGRCGMGLGAAALC
jgi:hypothetical protein